MNQDQLKLLQALRKRYLDAGKLMEAKAIERAIAALKQNK